MAAVHSPVDSTALFFSITSSVFSIWRRDCIPEGVTKLIRVLLIEDNPIDTRLIRADFGKFGSGEFDLTAVEKLSEAIRFLNENPIDVILLDLFLQDAAEGKCHRLSNVENARQSADRLARGRGRPTPRGART